MKTGFSLLEALIVIGILSVIATIGSGAYINYAREAEFNSVGKGIILDLKSAQAKAMSGEEGLRWGVNFVNGTDDYYEIFSTPTDYDDVGKVIDMTAHLQNSVSFTTPAESNSLVILFNRITGAPVSGAASVSVSSVSGKTKTVSISANGGIN